MLYIFISYSVNTYAVPHEKAFKSRRKRETNNKANIMKFELLTCFQFFKFKSSNILVLTILHTKFIFPKYSTNHL